MRTIQKRISESLITSVFNENALMRKLLGVSPKEAVSEIKLIPNSGGLYTATITVVNSKENEV